VEVSGVPRLVRHDWLINLIEIASIEKRFFFWISSLQGEKSYFEKKIFLLAGFYK